MALYHAKNGVIYISTTAAGAASDPGGMTSWSLNMPTDKVEVTAFGDTNKTYVQGLPDVSGSLSGFWDDTSDQLYDASQAGEAVNMYLYPTSQVTTKYWYGTAWVDFSIDVANTGAVSLSGDFVAAGAWGQM